MAIAKRSVAEPLWALVCAVGFIVLVNTPSFVSDSGGEFARLLFPSAAVLVLLLAWIGVELLSSWPPILNASMVALAASGIVAANIRSSNTAVNSSMEFAIMREAVGRMAQVKGAIKELLVIRPPFGRAYVGPPPFADEFDFNQFGLPVTTQI